LDFTRAFFIKKSKTLTNILKKKREVQNICRLKRFSLCFFSFLNARKKTKRKTFFFQNSEKYKTF
jgi:hypothetical protein